MAHVNLKTKPWRTPNFIRIDAEGEPGISIVDAAPELLAAMCDEFRKEVFQKAGKPEEL
jgi:hypothetical protein